MMNQICSVFFRLAAAPSSLEACILPLPCSVRLDIINGFLEFLDEFPHILLIDNHRLSEESALCVRRTRLYDIQKKIAIDIFLHIEEICAVILDKLGRKDLSTLYHNGPSVE